MNKILILMMAFVLIGSTFGMALTTSTSSSFGSTSGSPSVSSSSSSSGTQTQTSSKGGGSMLTKLGWNGEECVKRDVLSTPYLSHKSAVENWNVMPRYVKGVFQSEEMSVGDFVWKIRLYDGNFAIALDKTCDENVLDGNVPLTNNWWKIKLMSSQIDKV